MILRFLFYNPLSLSYFDIFLWDSNKCCTILHLAKDYWWWFNTPVTHLVHAIDFWLDCLRRCYTADAQDCCCYLRIAVIFFSFALGNERTLVTCKSCEARSKVYFNPYIYAEAMKTPLKVEKKINVNLFVTWLVPFIGNYLPQFSYAPMQANDTRV